MKNSTRILMKKWINAMIDRNVLKNKFIGEILFDEKMSSHTSYGVGGRVNAYIRPNNKP